MLLLKGKNEKRFLILRACSVFLSIVMIISMVMPMVRAEDSQTVPIESDTETGEADNTEDKSTLEELEELAGVEFAVWNIQAAGVTDTNFAQAIYDSIRADANNFTIVENRKERLASAEEIIEAGSKEGIEDIQYILSYFAGVIDAANKQISSIDGIRLLRRARMIDLKNNNIVNIMPMQGANNAYEVDDESAITKYWGSYARNTRINITENPIREYPSQMGGRLRMEDISYFIDNSLELPTEKVTILLGDCESNGVSTAGFDANIRCDGKPVIITFAGIYLENVDSEVDLADKYANESLGPISITGIKKSGEVIVGIPIQERSYINWWGVNSNSSSDMETPQATTFKWYKKFQIQLYTKVIAESETKGKVTISKIDKVEKNGLPGAEFTLYQKDTQGNEQVKEAKLTDKDGKVVFDELEPGDYVVKETKEPEGYKELTPEEREKQKKLFTVSGGSSIQVTSKSPNPITVNDGSGDKVLEKLENGAYIASGSAAEDIELVVNEAENNELRDIKVEWTKCTDGEERSEVFTTKEAAEEKIKKMTIEEYKNTKVTATFENRDENARELIFEVENEPKLGTLAISKKVENPEDLEIPENEEFDFEVKLWGVAGNELKTDYPYRIYTGPDFETIKKEGTITSGGIISLQDGEKAVIENLPLGKFEVLERLKDNQGYNVDSELSYRDAGDNILRQIEGNANKIGGSIEEDKDAEVKVTNTATKYKLSVRKDDAKGNPLAGAEFTLYYEDESGSESIDGLEGKFKEHGRGVTQLTEVSGEEGQKVKVAAVTFEELQSGKTYYLVETKVPTGHHKMKDYVKIEVKGGEIQAEGESAKRVPGTKNEFYVVITNKLNITLPKRGIADISWYTIIGTLLITGAAVAGSMVYRRKRNYE